MYCCWSGVSIALRDKQSELFTAHSSLKWYIKTSLQNQVICMIVSLAPWLCIWFLFAVAKFSTGAYAGSVPCSPSLPCLSVFPHNFQSFPTFQQTTTTGVSVIPHVVPYIPAFSAQISSTLLISDAISLWAVFQMLFQDRNGCTYS